MGDESTGSDGGSKREKSSKAMRRSSRSFLERAKSVFNRSSGERGAGVEALRGTSGADFEGHATVVRGQAGTAACCMGGTKAKDRVVLIKGPFCFVYGSETDPAPKYAIALVELNARVKKCGNSVLLAKGISVEYEFMFDNGHVAEQFQEAVTKQAAKGQAEEMRKVLGHEHLLKRKASILYAESVAMKKVGDQPDAPLTTTQVLDAIPMSTIPV